MHTTIGNKIFKYIIVSLLNYYFNQGDRKWDQNWELSEPEFLKYDLGKIAIFFNQPATLMGKGKEIEFHNGRSFSFFKPFLLFFWVHLVAIYLRGVF
jgi:hypothetical protein